MASRRFVSAVKIAKHNSRPLFVFTKPASELTKFRVPVLALTSTPSGAGLFLSIASLNGYRSTSIPDFGCRICTMPNGEIAEP